MLTTRKNRIPFTAAVLAASFTMPLAAQTAPAWNRHVEAIGVTALPGGGHRIHATFSVDATGILTFLNLDTRVNFFVNGSLVGSQVIAVDASPAGGCPISCLTIQPCICGQVGGETHCFCGGGFTTNCSTGASLVAGADIMVALVPAPGALPEPAGADNSLTIEYAGEQVYWDRWLSDIQITPMAGPGGMTHQVEVQLQAQYQGPLLNPMDLSTRVRVLRNGTPVAEEDIEITVHPPPAIASSAVPCGGSCPGHQYCYCGAIDFDCTCEHLNFQYLFGLEAAAGDSIAVEIDPVPGQLPELPGFTANDVITAIVPGTFSPADLNHDGVVNSLDLGIQLAAWSIPATAPGCGGVTPCPADLNHDGRVNSIDLGMLLTEWTLPAV